MTTTARMACISIAVSAACAGGPSIDLHLTPDPNVNTPEQVVARVQSVVVVLDSPEGLYLPGEERVGDGVQIENADGDPALELVATVPVGDHLPWIRIEQGSLDEDAILDVRVLGLPTPGGAPIASGMVAGLHVGQGDVDVPFDLLPAYLPPRVLDVIPGDGASVAGCVVNSIVIVLNKPVAPATAVEPGAIFFGDGEAWDAIRVDDSAAFIDVSPPTSWAFTTGNPPQYRLTVRSSVTDLDGVQLDQVPSLAGAQEYVHDFALTCTK